MKNGKMDNFHQLSNRFLFHRSYSKIDITLDLNMLFHFIDFKNSKYKS